MATIKFRLSAKSDKHSGKTEVLVRFFHGTIDQRAKTNLFVMADYWNDDRQCNTIPRVRVMNAESKSMIQELNDQNTRLVEIKEFINNAFIQAGAGKVKLPNTWLAEKMVEYNFGVQPGEAETLFQSFDRFINGRELSDTRKRNFMVAKRAFQRFCIYNAYHLSFGDITPEIIREFSQYIKNEHKLVTIQNNETTMNDGSVKVTKVLKFADPKAKLAFSQVPESRQPGERGQNYVSEILGKIRSFILWAIDEGLANENPFRNFEIPGCIYGTPYYITIDERNKLFNHDFTNKPCLAIQRDIFVFQCVIGCRVSDLKHLKKSSVINGAVEYIPRKTKEGNPVNVRVPLNSVARTILDRYKDIPGDGLLPCISDQKYNEDIKEMFKDAGLDRIVTILNPTTRQEEKRPLYEVASSHIARRCFIGNLYKQVKDPNLIGKLSGHKEGSKAFARYRDIDEEMRQDLVKMLE